MTDKQKAAELDVPRLSAEEKRHTEHMKLNANDPRKGAEADRIARKGIVPPTPGGRSKKETHK